jgi:hypothetical protein
MIHEPVVLVLGAGASKPYGYPLGSDLRRLLATPSGTLVRLMVAAGHDSAAIGRFAAELTSSNLASIDVFLERRQALAPLGRAMIAGAILQHENKVLAGNWYEYLWQQLVQDAPTLEAFGRNILAVITFNYDTSFERFLVNSIRATYDVKISAALKAFEAIPVIHVHGQIPYQIAASASIPSDAKAATIQAYSDTIITLHQGEDNSREFATARHWLSEARHVAFLGFSFHPVNVRRLKVPDWIGGRRTVIGSALGMVGQEIDRAVNLFAPGSIRLSPQDCLEFARHNVAIFD